MFKKYSVGKPSKKRNFSNSDCRPFNTISHVTHIDQSIQILKDGIIRPRLVYDKSKLNTKRILINWLSPNHWSSGYRYGNIKFTFNWNDIIQNSNFYSIETINYKIPACRILVTDLNRSNELTPYDPTKRNGPWWYDKKKDIHYFNGDNVCLEIMLERELDINKCTRIDIVKHHNKWCSIHSDNPSQCIDLGRKKPLSQARFIAKILAEEIDFQNLNVLNFINKQNDIITPSDILNESLYYLILDIDKQDVRFEGTLESNKKEAISFAKSICNFYSQLKLEDVSNVARYFKTKNDMKESLKKLTAKTFNIDDYTKIMYQF